MDTTSPEPKEILADKDRFDAVLRKMIAGCPILDAFFAARVGFTNARAGNPGLTLKPGFPQRDTYLFASHRGSRIVPKLTLSVSVLISPLDLPIE